MKTTDKNSNRINNIIEALSRHADTDSIRVLNEIGTNSSIDEIREKTAHALLRKNTPEALKLVIGSEGKGINDLSARVAMSTINEILEMPDKTQVLEVLQNTISTRGKKQVKDTARSVKTLITYSIS